MTIARSREPVARTLLSLSCAGAARPSLLLYAWAARLGIRLARVAGHALTDLEPARPPESGSGSVRAGGPAGVAQIHTGAD